ncbi:MAG: hypothetical protein SGPRY_010347 [Prymnesium sp.]
MGALRDCHENEISLQRVLWRELSCVVATGTGRLSARCPNVQQVPKGVTKLRADVSPQEVETCVRAAFVPPPGYVLMSADYTQLEMRLMAAFSRDAKLGEPYASELASTVLWQRLEGVGVCFQTHVAPIQRREQRQSDKL